jgi:hypothetical protein
MEALQSGQAEYELGAIIALGFYGSDSQSAVPLLVQQLEKHKDVDMHSQHALETLARIGPAARAAIPELSKRLHAEGEPGTQYTMLKARLEVVKVLLKIDPANGQALETLREALSNNSQGIYILAFGCLNEIDPDAAKPLVPTLLEIMQHEKNTSGNIGNTTAAALKRIDPGLAEAEFKRLGYKGRPDMDLRMGRASKRGP